MYNLESKLSVRSQLRLYGNLLELISAVLTVPCSFTVDTTKGFELRISGLDSEGKFRLESAMQLQGLHLITA